MPAQGVARFPGTCLLPVSVVLLVLAGRASADLIQYQFTGTVSAIVDPYHELDGLVQLGDSYSAVFTFDTAAPDLAPNDPTLGLYEGPSATLLMPHLSAQTAASLDTGHDVTGDSMRFNAAIPGLSFAVGFDDYSGTTLTNDALPTPMEVAKFGEGWLDVHLDPGPAKFTGPAVIPEPNTLALLLLGVAGVLLGRGT